MSDSNKYENVNDGFYRGCLFVICLLLGVIAYFSWQIYEILDAGIWKNLLPS